MNADAEKKGEEDFKQWDPRRKKSIWCDAQKERRTSGDTKRPERPVVRRLKKTGARKNRSLFLRQVKIKEHIGIQLIKLGACVLISALPVVQSA